MCGAFGRAGAAGNLWYEVQQMGLCRPAYLPDELAVRGFCRYEKNSLEFWKHVCISKPEAPDWWLYDQVRHRAWNAWNHNNVKLIADWIQAAALWGWLMTENQSIWWQFMWANPNAVILAEHYGSPVDWLDGKQWDSVMNYDAFMEPLTWFLTGIPVFDSWTTKNRYIRTAGI